MSLLRKVPRMFKVTLWFDPVEYYQLMKLSTELEFGKISMHKFIKKSLALEDRKKFDVQARYIQSVVNHVALPPRRPQQQQQAIAAHTVRKPLSPRRRLAA